MNNLVEASDYIVRLEHEGGKGMLAHKDKVAVFVRKTGDSIFSKSTLSVGGAVEDACAAIGSDWTAHGKELAAESAALAAGGSIGSGSRGAGGCGGEPDGGCERGELRH